MSINADKFLEIDEQSSVDTPASGKGRIYFKTDGKLYMKDDTGSEQEVGAGGAGTSVEVNQSSHNFEVGDIIRYANQSGETGYVLSQADTEETVYQTLSECFIVLRLASSGIIAAGARKQAGQETSLVPSPQKDSSDAEWAAIQMPKACNRMFAR